MRRYRGIRFEAPEIQAMREYIGDITDYLNKANGDAARLSQLWKKVYEKYYPESQNLKEAASFFESVVRKKIADAESVMWNMMNKLNNGAKKM